MTADYSYAALDALPVHAGVVDASGAIVWVNESWRRFAGCNGLGNSPRSPGDSYLLTADVGAVACDAAEVAADGVRALLAGERDEFTLDYPCRTSSEELWFRLLARPFGERPDAGVVVMHVDVTERKRLEQQLCDLTLHDPLTGLPSRVLLKDRFEQALLNSSRSNGRLAVLVLDLDGFKAVNERLGRQAGDEVLVEVGRRLRPLLRAGDTAARYDGDEFVILLLEIRSAEEAVGVAGRIVSAFDPPFQAGRSEIAIRASIGVAVEWSHLHTSTALLEAADYALRQAKRERWSRVVLFDGDADP